MERLVESNKEFGPERAEWVFRSRSWDYYFLREIDRFRVLAVRKGSLASEKPKEYFFHLLPEDRWECQRCGDCCKAINCGRFKVIDGKAICKIYPKRRLICRIFPINPMKIFTTDPQAGLPIETIAFTKSPTCPGWGNGETVYESGLFEDFAENMVEWIITEPEK